MIPVAKQVSPQELTELILDSITEGVFTVDPDMRILSFNQAAQNITGISAREAVGKKCHQILRAGICGTSCPLRQSMATGPARPGGGRGHNRHDGSLIPVRIRTTVLNNSRGEVVGGVETFRDLSEVHHLRKRLTGGYTFCDLKGKSEPMRQLFRVLPEAALSGATVLIRGESGTGKELVARGPARPLAQSRRALCGRELRGHPRGAHGGASFSATCAGPLPARTATVRAAWPRPRGAPCFWTRWATCPWACR